MHHQQGKKKKKKEKKKMRVVRRLCLDAKSGRCVLFVFREELSCEKAAG